jgi:Raf kinase inhibitor-like YbhB/YbcL family protein
MTLPRAACTAALSVVLLAGCGSADRASSTAVGASQTPTRSTATTAQSATSSSATTTSPTATSATATRTNATSTTAITSASVTPATLAKGFHLRSPAFVDGAQIPSIYTCDGNGISPPLQFTGAPPGTRELVLVMRDAEAPGGDFVHWAVAGIPPHTADLPPGGVPGLVSPGINSFGSLGYRGPCPPVGAKAHHYVFSLSALSTPSGLRPGFHVDQLQSTAIGIATLIGTYARR